jgi:hypothetical protein
MNETVTVLICRRSIHITTINTNHGTCGIHLQNGGNSGLIKVQEVSCLRPLSQIVTRKFNVPSG